MAVFEKYGFGNKIAYGMGNVGDTIAYQTFTFFIFVFYYAVVGLNTWWIMVAFIIWSIWNAVNDPLLGLVSDKTKAKMGRRKFWILIAVVPLSVIMVLLWTPPAIFGIPTFNNPFYIGHLLNWIYFLVIIVLFDFFYTMFSLNTTAAFPEMYMDQLDRNQASLIRRVLTIVGLIIAVILPTLIIGDTKSPTSLTIYPVMGIVVGILVAVNLGILLKWGLKERKEFQHDPEVNPGFVESLKITLKNKSFLILVLGNLGNWYVYGIIPTVVLLYGQWVLGVPAGLDILSMVLLLATFLSAAALMPIWKKIGDKIGNRNAMIWTFIAWGGGLIPIMFVTGPLVFDFTLFLMAYIPMLIIMMIVGFGISGSIYLMDLVISDVIDEDEVNTGVRREGAFYGVNALIIRLATILVMVSIALVFGGTGWADYTPYILDPTFYILGLKILMSVLPAIACFLAAICFWIFPLHGKKLDDIKEKLAELHAKKQKDIKSA
ncbi:MAG: MFS transporter [Candidatus Helarchaeota archaeon]